MRNPSPGIVSLALALGLAFVFRHSAASADGEAQIVLDPSTRHQTILGYGQGSMDQFTVPWFERLSEDERERLLDRLYTLDGDGLGLTVCRTYVCAGDAPGHRHFDRRPGAPLHPHGSAPEACDILCAGHDASLWHARGAAARGAMMVAFWNSPPWWLTVSGCTAGSADGGPNLRAGSEERFARHIADVLLYYRDAWGLAFDAVSPINEPEADWWREGGGQDGCHVGSEQAAEFLAALRAELTGRGLDIRIHAYEAAYGNGVDYLDRLLADERARAAIDDLTCHQYIATRPALRAWRQRASLHGKPLWMSEWGDWTHKGMDLALNVAARLHEAHRAMGAEAWCLWEPGFLFDEADGRLEPNPGYYALAQFSRFARPGMQVIEASEATLETTAYLDEASRTVAIVTTNRTDEAIRARYDLSSFEGVREALAWRTSETERLTGLPAIPADDGFAADLPARSITTFMATYAALG